MPWNHSVAGGLGEIVFNLLFKMCHIWNVPDMTLSAFHKPWCLHFLYSLHGWLFVSISVHTTTALTFNIITSTWLYISTNIKTPVVCFSQIQNRLKKVIWSTHVCKNFPIDSSQCSLLLKTRHLNIADIFKNILCNSLLHIKKSLNESKLKFRWISGNSPK